MNRLQPELIPIPAPPAKILGMKSFYSRMLRLSNQISKAIDDLLLQEDISETDWTDIKKICGSIEIEFDLLLEILKPERKRNK